MSGVPFSDNDTVQERRALKALDRFIRNHAADLAAIAGWGDGRGGWIGHTIADAVLGPPVPKAPNPEKGRTISAAVRRRVMDRDRYRCVRCESHEALRIDHVHPWSRGGTNDESNLQTLCHPCNQAKGARIEGAGA